MKNLKQLLKRLFCISKSLPDHYAGELNTKRIKAYKMLAAVFLSLIISTLKNKLKISLKYL